MDTKICFEKEVKDDPEMAETSTFTSKREHIYGALIWIETKLPCQVNTFVSFCSLIGSGNKPAGIMKQMIGYLRKPLCLTQNLSYEKKKNEFNLLEKEPVAAAHFHII